MAPSAGTTCPACGVVYYNDLGICPDCYHGATRKPTARRPGQWEAVVGVLRYPRRTFERLPSDRIYALAFVAPIYFGSVSAIQRFGWNFAIFVVSIVVPIGMVLVPAYAWVIRQVLKLFGKRLSTKKLLNIGGYALVPRLALAVVATPLQFLSVDRWGRSLSMSVLALALATLAYSVLLYIYGIVVSPSEEGAGAGRT